MLSMAEVDLLAFLAESSYVHLALLRRRVRKLLLDRPAVIGPETEGEAVDLLALGAGGEISDRLWLFDRH
jgi:hypothetical protein